MSIPSWAGVYSPIARHIALRKKQCLAAYRENPLLVIEHSNIERSTAQGGYGRRQIYELVQNGADALIESAAGRIQVVLTEKALYCANQGSPIDNAGVDAILSSHVSMKRGTEIGRFGLGFKSVLGITVEPLFFSRTGSFAFSKKRSEDEIRAIVNNAERVPYLRIAESIDPIAHAQRDRVLGELMAWATTVVVLPFADARSTWLPEDIKKFPSEFLLFSPHVGSLDLEDWMNGLARHVRLKSNNGTIALEEGTDSCRWKAFHSIHKPTERARQEAGELADRESLPLIWAVPMQGRSARGVFWAFFPTEYFTTLSGIVNAPWKTNEDRQNLLTGLFNEEMISSAAQLVADNLHALVDPTDPGKYLELLPARGKESPNWADQLMTERVYTLAAQRACLPDQNGKLQPPGALKLHPPDMPKDALEHWGSHPGRPTNWCHHSIETRERRSRTERILSQFEIFASAVPTWLEALVQDKTPAASVAAIKTAASIVQHNSAQLPYVQLARIIRTTDDTFVAPTPGAVFTPRSEDADNSKLTLVHGEVVAMVGAKEALATLGIRDVDAASELESLLSTVTLFHLTAAGWTQFWSLVRSLPVETAKKLIRAKYTGKERSQIKVRTVAGDFNPIQKCLLPGTIIPEGANRDRSILIDTAFHQAELDLLKALGAVSGPELGGGSLEEDWFVQYRNVQTRAFVDNLETPKKPDRNYLEFAHTIMVGPLEPIRHLSSEGKALFTEAMLLDPSASTPWTLQHSTQTGSWPKRTCDSPAVWLAKIAGCMRTTLGIKSLHDSVSPALLEWAQFLPIAQCSEEIAERIGLPTTLAQLTHQQWAATGAATNMAEFSEIARFYAAASAVIKEPPWYLTCQIGTGRGRVAAPKITAVASQAGAAALMALEIPYLPASEENALILCRNWGLQPADKTIKTEAQPIPSGPEIPLLDQYPGLYPKLDPNLHDARLIPCASIRVECRTGNTQTAEDRDLYRDGTNLYYLASLSADQLLDAVTDTLKISLELAEKQDILNYRRQAESRERTHAVRLEKTLAGKLLLCLGETAIRARLPLGLLNAYEHEHGNLSHAKIAELALAVHGVETLRFFKEELAAKGLQPPAMWAGGQSARAFVKSLGFPVEFAGFGQARREPILEVDGPPNLPPLHSFQQKAAQQIHELPKRKDGRRGLLSFPTGAGKTRVAVEALTQMVKADTLQGPILWVAQTDELCEQAVQTWSYVWRSLGPERPLLINRLWAQNEADPAPGSTQIIVATIAKLQVCMAEENYHWLAEDTQWLVIDEAHGAVEKSYTALLEWMGLGRSNDRCPMIGLTATPFRGGEEETVRLVNRFGAHRLDWGSFRDDPYRELQDMGVLARVDHQLLKGATLTLTAKELEDLTRTKLLPAAVMERLGSNASRNSVLLKTVKAMPSDWPVLLFATSVEHAQTLAALLSIEGISAATISATTEPGARRYYVESFRRGKLRVLTNYGVLTAGFDAPSVRAIIVARPTYSPVTYQQMIGRGLRGPKNGGKERCLVVNVEDNILRFQENLAFTQFEYLWAQSGTGK